MYSRKLTTVVIAALLALGMGGAVIFFSSCNSTSGDRASSQPSAMAAPNSQSADAAVYTCPMHPEVVSDQPGKCPICGMNLVKKGKDTGMMNMDHGAEHMNMGGGAQGGTNN